MHISTISSKGVRSMDKAQKDYVLRHSSKRDKELKYDFMPSMLEIIERPAHKAGTVIILWRLVFCCRVSSLLLFSAAAAVTLGATTAGTIKTDPIIN